MCSIFWNGDGRKECPAQTGGDPRNCRLRGNDQPAGNVIARSRRCCWPPTTGAAGSISRYVTAIGMSPVPCIRCARNAARNICWSCRTTMGCLPQSPDDLASSSEEPGPALKRAPAPAGSSVESPLPRVARALLESYPCALRLVAPNHDRNVHHSRRLPRSGE